MHALPWRLVGVPINNPAGAMAWATSAIGGGVWGVGGVASDGTNPFITTGNTFNTGGNWMGGEAAIRFQPGPIFTGSPDDYWAPVNWLTLDINDQDLAVPVRYWWTCPAQHHPLW